MKNLVRESLLTEKMETEQVIVTVRKGSGENLKKLLDHIKEIGNIGHSFEIVVDPEKITVARYLAQKIIVQKILHPAGAEARQPGVVTGVKIG